MKTKLDVVRDEGIGDGLERRLLIFVLRVGVRWGHLFLHRGLVVFFGVSDAVVGGLGLEKQRALVIFPDAEDDEGNCGGGGPEFGVARNFGFGFPPKELGGNKKRENGPAGEGRGFDPDFPDAFAEIGGALESPD